MSHAAQPIDTRWPHRWAVLLVCCTFPLIWVGGLVTTYDAGMAVPDWPTTYGYNLFVYPWQTWVFGPWDLFIEHGHRLLGATVGLLAIALAISIFRCDPRRWMRHVAILAVLGVIAQGVLGGMRVRMDDRQLAMLHGCLGPAFFAFTVAIAVMTSRFWHRTHEEVQQVHRLITPILITASLTYVQLVVGATIRHLPAFVTPNFFRALVMFHLFIAAAIVAHAILLVIRVFRRRHECPSLLPPTLALQLLILGQVGLGAATWVMKYGWPSWMADWTMVSGFTVQAKSLPQTMTVTAHVAVGSLVFVTSVLMAVRASRLFLRLQSADEKMLDTTLDSRPTRFPRENGRRTLAMESQS